MIRSIKYFIAIILFAVTSYHAMATHLVGQDITYAYLGDTAGLQHYRITFTLYADCLNGNTDAIAADNPAFLGVFDAVTNATIAIDTLYNLSDTTMPILAYGLCDSGAASFPVCMLRRIFKQDMYLPASTHGYNIIYQRCCFNDILNIVQAENTGMTAICTIPPSSLAASNNSALFINYPPYVIPVNHPLVFNCAAYDIDGDSLSYGFSSALNVSYAYANVNSDALPAPTPPPLDSISYMPPLTCNYPITCSVPLSIDPVTGLLTGTPSSVGTYLIQVECKEWRGGVLINKVQREFEFVVANCPSSPIHEVMNVFPNPAVSEITVTLNTQLEQLVVTDDLGRKIDVPWYFDYGVGTSSYPEAATIDVSLLPTGVYFVKVNKNMVGKFIKQE